MKRDSTLHELYSLAVDFEVKTYGALSWEFFAPGRALFFTRGCTGMRSMCGKGWHVATNEAPPRVRLAGAHRPDLSTSDVSGIVPLVRPALCRANEGDVTSARAFCVKGLVLLRDGTSSLGDLVFMFDSLLERFLWARKDDSLAEKRRLFHALVTVNGSLFSGVPLPMPGWSNASSTLLETVYVWKSDAEEADGRLALVARTRWLFDDSHT